MFIILIDHREQSFFFKSKKGFKTKLIELSGRPAHWCIEERCPLFNIRENNSGTTIMCQRTEEASKIMGKKTFWSNEYLNLLYFKKKLQRLIYSQFL